MGSVRGVSVPLSHPPLHPDSASCLPGCSSSASSLSFLPSITPAWPPVRFENEKLREELDRLKRVLGPGPQGANEKLLNENALLVSQVGESFGGSDDFLLLYNPLPIDASIHCPSQWLTTRDVSCSPIISH